jgi:predicted ATPase/DNA-binding winged helix-turn-helix (wHTH) protein
VFVFDGIRVDVPARAVWRAQERVSLTEKELELLLLLVANPGVALERERIIAHLWPDTVVEDGNLSVHVSRLRRALGDTEPTRRYIETVPQWGYRFIAELTQAALAPTKALEGGPANTRAWELPAQTTAFVGREQELSRILTLLSNPEIRLVSILGPGGVGKTRLALEVCRRVSPQSSSLERDAAAGRERGAAVFDDGVRFVSLAALDAAPLLGSALAQALGVALLPGADVLVQLADALSGREVLLALDNFEQLLASAPLISDLLRRTSRVKVLTTSRERLGLTGETVFPLAGMSGAETGVELASSSAARLFCACAKRREATFALHPHDEPALARILRAVDGLPLGIELAASWVPLLTLEEIANEVDRDLGFLESTLRDVPERQRSLRVVFEHSFDLLNGAEQASFARLGCFRGGFARGAAQTVACADLHVLSTLFDKCLLVRAEQTGRYGLHEVLRQFALGKLQEDPSEHHRTLDAHSEYFASFLAARGEALRETDASSTLAEIDAELDNVRAAVAWMIERKQLDELDRALGPLELYYTRRAAIVEANQVLERAERGLERCDGAERERTARTLGAVLTARSRHLRELGRYRAAVEASNRALALLAAPAHANARAYALVEASSALLWSGSPAEAVARARAGVALFRELKDDWGLLFALDRLGSVCGGYCGGAGDFASAERAYRECAELHRSLGLNAWLFPATLAGLGFVLSRQGSYAEGLELMEQSLSLIRRSGDVWQTMTCLLNLANTERVLGRYTSAEAHAEECLALACRSGSWEFETWAYYQLGDILKEQGRLAEATRFFEGGRERSQQAADVGRTAVALLNLGDIAFLQGRLDQAESLLHESLQGFERVSEVWGIVLALDNLGYLACQAGDAALARERFRRALALALRARLLPYASSVLAGFALLELEAGALERAVELLSLIDRHPATEHQTRARRVQPLLRRSGAALSKKRFEAAVAASRRLDLEAEAMHLRDARDGPLDPPRA